MQTKVDVQVATEQEAEQRRKTNAQKYSKAFVGSSVGGVVK